MQGRLVGVTLCVLFGLMTGGCYSPAPATFPGKPVSSQVPVPNAYPLSTQQKMQAVHHWGVLAEDVAGIFAERMAELFPEQQDPIYVAPGGTTPFAKGFRELLITKLVERGLSVSTHHKAPLVLVFETQLVKHSRRLIKTHTGVYKALAPGFFVQRDTPLAGPENRIGETEFLVATSELNVEAGEYTIRLPATELMVNLSLMQKGEFIMRRSAVYYINDPEWWHYGQKVEIRDPAVRQYTLVNQ